MQSTGCPQHLEARPQVEVIGVAENDLRLHLLTQLAEMHAFHCAAGTYWHEDGGEYLSMVGGDDAGARIRVGVVVLNFEFHALSVFDALLSSFVSSSLTVRSTGLATNSSVSAKSHTCCTFST